MQWLGRIFGRKKKSSAQRDVDDILKGPIGGAIKDLARQHADAAAKGQRIVNRIPDFVRANMLKAEMIRRLRELPESELDITSSDRNLLDEINVEGPLGEVGSAFDKLRLRVGTATLKKIENDIRTEDGRSPRPNYDDVAPLA